jgi:tetratricopeptide (TPR) repeat protein
MRLPAARALAPAALLSAAFGCGTVRVSVPVTRPAEINMSSYPTIGVGGLSGSNHEVVATALEEGLVRSGRFKVVDREHLASVMRELQLSASDLADPNKASKLGKQITANALIFGTIEERWKQDRRDEPYQDNKGVRHMKHILMGEANVSATFKVTDVSTGTLITAKTLEKRRGDSSTGYDEQPRAIDREGLSRGARKAVLDEFLASIVPHQEMLDATFFTDGDLPQLETGIGYAQHGDWKQALDAFNGAVSAGQNNPKIATKTLGKAYWDLALAYEYSGDYDKAGQMVDKAYQLTNDGDMLAEKDNIKRLQEDAAKLKQQTAAPASDESTPSTEVVHERQ